MGPSEQYNLSRRDSELLRISASVMVVVAHCIHFWVQDFYAARDIASLGFAATVLDQFTRFTVPFFLFLSGFGLTQQFLSHPPKLSAYYRFRLPKILAPFLIWSVLASFRHLDFLATLPWRGEPFWAAGRLVRFLFVDGFDYQFYFLIVIFQFYLVFPLLYRLARPPRAGWVLAGFFLLHMTFMSPTDVYLGLAGRQLPILHSNLIVFYGFYCVVGMVAAWHRNFLAGLLRRWSGPQVFVFWAASLGLLLFEYWMNLRAGKGLYDTDHFNRWSVVVYCLASMLLFMKGKDRFARLHRSPDWAFLQTGVAPYTFFVYLFHTHMLRLIDYLCWEVTVWDFINRIIWVVGGSYAVAWLAQWLLEDFPRLRFMLGLPKAPLRRQDLPGAVFLARRKERAAAAEGMGDSVPRPETVAQAAD